MPIPSPICCKPQPDPPGPKAAERDEQINETPGGRNG